MKDFVIPVLCGSLLIQTLLLIYSAGRLQDKDKTIRDYQRIVTKWEQADKKNRETIAELMQLVRKINAK